VRGVDVRERPGRPTDGTHVAGTRHGPQLRKVGPAPTPRSVCCRILENGKPPSIPTSPSRGTTVDRPTRTRGIDEPWLERARRTPDAAARRGGWGVGRPSGGAAPVARRAPPARLRGAARHRPPAPRGAGRRPRGGRDAGDDGARPRGVPQARRGRAAHLGRPAALPRRRRGGHAAHPRRPGARAGGAQAGRRARPRDARGGRARGRRAARGAARDRRRAGAPGGALAAAGARGRAALLRRHVGGGDRGGARRHRAHRAARLGEGAHAAAPRAGRLRAAP
jgi:hypothetical protein